MNNNHQLNNNNPTTHATAPVWVDKSQRNVPTILFFLFSLFKLNYYTDKGFGDPQPTSSHVPLFRLPPSSGDVPAFSFPFLRLSYSHKVVIT